MRKGIKQSNIYVYEVLTHEGRRAFKVGHGKNLKSRKNQYCKNYNLAHVGEINKFTMPHNSLNQQKFEHEAHSALTNNGFTHLFIKGKDGNESRELFVTQIETQNTLADVFRLINTAINKHLDEVELAIKQLVPELEDQNRHESIKLGNNISSNNNSLLASHSAYFENVVFPDDNLNGLYVDLFSDIEGAYSRYFFSICCKEDIRYIRRNMINEEMVRNDYPRKRRFPDLDGFVTERAPRVEKECDFCTFPVCTSEIMVGRQSYFFCPTCVLEETRQRQCKNNRD